MQQRTTLPGDVLLVTAFISYAGCFTKQYRLDLLNKMWIPFLRTLEVKEIACNFYEKQRHYLKQYFNLLATNTHNRRLGSIIADDR